jgi:hypothetical protein
MTDPIGWPGPALPERPSIPRVSEADAAPAAPRLLSPGAASLLILLLSLGLWGLIWIAIAALWR